MELTALMEEAARRRASDVHLVPGEPPVFRVGGALERDDSPALAAEWFHSRLLPALPEPTRRSLEEGTQPAAEAILTGSSDAVAFSLTVFRSGEGFAANLRVVLTEIPALDLIGGDALEAFMKTAELPRGLVLIAGPTGSGKQTTASAIVDHVNRTRAERIYVLEDNLGYRWKNQQSVVTTLRVGGGSGDYDTYERAAQTLLRGADPDVVYFTDLPNADALRQALVLADTGHLVIANLMAESAAGAVEYLARALPAPPEAGRDVLARTLVAAFGQRLLPRREGAGRVPLYEILQVTPRVREIVRAEDAAASALEAAMATGENGSRTRGDALDRLLSQGQISEETANAFRAA